MSVKILDFNTWDYIHDDFPSHGGTIDPSTISYGKNSDGSDNLNIVAVPCPVDGSVSYWPSGGGADALLGQSLHVVMAYKNPIAETKTVNDAAAQVKQRVIDTDGEERWVIDDATLTVLKIALNATE